MRVVLVRSIGPHTHEKREEKKDRWSVAFATCKILRPLWPSDTLRLLEVQEL